MCLCLYYVSQKKLRYYHAHVCFLEILCDCCWIWLPYRIMHKFIRASFVALYYVVYMHALRIRFLPYPSCRCLPLSGCRNLKG
jgi:hypothetical protein